MTAAESADQALAILESGTVADILFSDIRMPGRLNGIQLAHWVREHRPGMAILLQTGFADADTEGFRVLRKPFTPDELAARLRVVLGERSQRPE